MSAPPLPTRKLLLEVEFLLQCIHLQSPRAWRLWVQDVRLLCQIGAKAPSWTLLLDELRHEVMVASLPRSLGDPPPPEPEPVDVWPRYGINRTSSPRDTRIRKRVGVLGRPNAVDTCRFIETIRATNWWRSIRH